MPKTQDSAVKAQGSESAEKPKEEAKPVSPEKNYDLQVQRTKDALAQEPKVQFIIPLSPGEKEGADEIVIVNGYSFRIKKNCMVTIPKTVADILSNKYQVEMEAGRNHLIDNSEDRKTALQ